MNNKQFIEEIEKINIKINENQEKQLEKYFELLVEYNKVMNLTTIIEKDQVYLKHFYDSLTIIKAVDLNKEKTLCDIGTGAGFPGLVLKIVFPNLKVVLLDSLNKRIKFLEVVIKELNLQNVEVIHIRAEEYAINNRNKFDVTTARAVAHSSILLEYAIPITKCGKYFVALKGNISEEKEELKNSLKKLDTELINIFSFTLPYEESKRNIMLFKKIKDNKKFPRKYSEIKENRL